MSNIFVVANQSFHSEKYSGNERFADKGSHLITSFTGEHAFLSNFYPQGFYMKNQWFKSAEHAFQAAKAFKPEERQSIIDSCTARDARSVGSSCSAIDGWKDIRIEVMREVLRCKFSVTNLAEMLLTTDDKYLIEGNSWEDRFWGCEIVRGDFVGENNLGKLLMEIRKELQAESK
jgi:ribA/ribD-fused uncharacterized protein